MLILRLAKRTDIRHQPDTGTEWAEGQHPYPQEDGIPEFTPEHICGASSWSQFFQWWHDPTKYNKALEKDHSVYLVDIPDELVLVGRNQVMFRPEDARSIRKLQV